MIQLQNNTHHRSKYPMSLKRELAGRWLTVWSTAILLITANAAYAQTPADKPASNPNAAAESSTPTPNPHDAEFSDYRFRDSESLARLRLHYVTLGTPHRDSHGQIDNAVLVLHWTASSGASMLSPEFMRSLYAPGQPLDASRYYLIIPDNIGHGQSSKPSDGLKTKFPHYGYGDMVDLQHKLVTEVLGVKQLLAIVGVSMGGMNAWQWAETYPDDVKAVMPIVSLPVKVSGRNLLWRRIVIDGIRKDPGWDNGKYTAPIFASIQGWRVSRMMIDGVPHLQSSVPDTQAAEAFLHATDQQTARSDANDLLYSLESSQDYDPQPKLESIKASLFALNFTDDEFNPDELQILQSNIHRVPHGTYFVQKGGTDTFGHLTMAHPALWAEQVRRFMNRVHGDTSTASK
ncbi:alpha/beta fold hydrolase [Paraburkholderia sp. 32]|uniref:alpha/beta fold hydrolase n=1 Tax=Paraburkholderia sp. 32 TaxID=2991057 RepID=UPI003D203DD8